MTLAANSALCRVLTLWLAAPLFYSPYPRGTCTNCCAIREREDVRFLLYTRRNPTKPQNLYLADERRLYRSDFNLNDPLAVYLHGFSESATGENQSSQQMKDAFLKAGNYNVILVDWSPMVAAPWYREAVDNLPVTARYVARFLRFLLGSGYDARQIHLIGFSLGAEVAGFTGKQLQEWGIKLPRITGLDPPLPLFERGSGNRRLSPADARFVDIIHTDGGILGNPEAMGHADFYPNGGRPLQPGCVRHSSWVGIIIGCSHQRAWEYFIESVRWPLAFPANRCEPSNTFAICKDGGAGRAFMGMAADRRLRGKFFLDTNDDSPFGRNAAARSASSAATTKSTSTTTTAATTKAPSSSSSSIMQTLAALVKLSPGQAEDMLTVSGEASNESAAREEFALLTTPSPEGPSAVEVGP